MAFYTALKIVHIVSSTVLFGTGLGIAFFMLMAHRTRDVRLIAHTAGIVVIADLVFTATAVVVQPVTGSLMVSLAGYRYSDTWLLASIILYVVAGACWLPVVWIQNQVNDLARAAAATEQPLPARYFRLFGIWIALGVPAFLAVIHIFVLMVAKPQ